MRSYSFHGHVFLMSMCTICNLMILVQMAPLVHMSLFQIFIAISDENWRTQKRVRRHALLTASSSFLSIALTKDLFLKNSRISTANPPPCTFTDMSALARQYCTLATNERLEISELPFGICFW